MSWNKNALIMDAAAGRMLIFVNYSELKKQHGKNNFDRRQLLT